MADRPPQPKRLNASASEPTLHGSRHNPEEGQADIPPGWGSTQNSVTRPGRHQLPVTGNSATFGASASVALYATPSYSSLYVEPEDLEPGPGTYDIPVCLGTQTLSTKDSAPHVSITAKHDKSWAKVLISKDHSDAFKCRDTPGPGTYIPGEPNPTQQRVRFGTGKRKPLADTSFRAPGPVYEVRGAPDCPRASIKFSKANRFSRDGKSLADQLACAGPGQYELPTVFDGVNQAKSFGASHRAYDNVRFPGSEKVFFGRASPGPGSCKPMINDAPRVSFGRAERLPGNNNSKRAPGPGAYDAHERAWPWSRNQSCYGFGRPHAKGRLDMKQIIHCQNSTWGLK